MRLSIFVSLLLTTFFSGHLLAQEACDLAFQNSTPTFLENAKSDLQRLIQEYNKSSDPIGRKLLQSNIESLLVKIKSLEPQFKIEKSNLANKTELSEKALAENHARAEEEKQFSLPQSIDLIRSEYRIRDVLGEIDPSLSTRVLTAAKADPSSDRNEFNISTTSDLHFIEFKTPQLKWLPLLSEKKYFIDLNANETLSSNRLLELKYFKMSSTNAPRFFVTQDRQHLVIAQAQMIKIYKLNPTSSVVDTSKPLRTIEAPVLAQNSSIEALALSDGLRHLSYYSSRKLFLMDLSTMKVTSKDYLDAPLLKFSPDGNHLVVFGGGHIKIFNLQNENLETQSFFANFSQMGHFDEHILWTNNNRYVAVTAPGALTSINVLVYDTESKREVQFDEHVNFRTKEAKSLSASWNQSQDTLTIASSNANTSMIFFLKPKTAMSQSMTLKDGKIKKIKWNNTTQLEILATQNIDGTGVATINYYEVN